MIDLASAHDVLHLCELITMHTPVCQWLKAHRSALVYVYTSLIEVLSIFEA
jgi:hypothetical protein